MNLGNHITKRSHFTVCVHLERLISNLCVFVNNYHLQFILIFSTLEKSFCLPWRAIIQRFENKCSKDLPPPLSLLPSPPKRYILKYDCNFRMIIVMIMKMIMTMIVITTMTTTMMMTMSMKITMKITMTIMKMIKITKFYRLSGDIVTSEPIRFSFSFFLHSASLCISSWPSYWWLVHWASCFMRMRCPRLTTHYPWL